LTKGGLSKAHAKEKSHPSSNLCLWTRQNRTLALASPSRGKTRHVVEKAKFSRGEQSSKDSVDPYAIKLGATPISRVLLQQIVKQLPSMPRTNPPGRYVKRFKVYTAILGGSTEKLKQVEIFLYTPGLKRGPMSPS
jgi:hypothetical protein